MKCPQLDHPFIHIKQVFSADEIAQIKSIYSSHAPSSGLPCYAFLERQDCPLIDKLKGIIHSQTQHDAHYLNDFFFFTGSAFSTPWHVDTELFIFKYAVNAWILLEPSAVEDPLGFVEGVNSPGCRFYQSAEKEADELLFVDFTSNDILEVPISQVEASQIHTPTIEVGDLLLIDPMRFHRTNTTLPKGACVFKFVYSDSESLVRPKHIPAAMWPEISLYKSLLSRSNSWDALLSKISTEVKQNGRRSPLISGFYPDNFEYLVKKAEELQTD